MAGQFDAATDRVSRTTAPNPALGLTWCAWVRIDTDLNEFSTFMRLHASGGGSTTLVVGTGSDGTTPRVFSPSNTTGAVGTSMAVGTWYFVAYTYNPTGNAVTLYLGALGGGALASFTATVAPGVTPDGLTLAGRSSGDSTETTQGSFARVRMWSGAVFTLAALEAERASTTPVVTSGLWANWPLSADLLDASGNGRHLTAGSTAISYVADPASGGAVALTGTGPGAASSTGALGVARPLSGTASGASSAMGDLAVARGLSGSGVGAGGVSGDLVVTRGLAGVASAASFSAGELGVQESLALEGISSAASDAMGNLAILRGLSGVATAASGADGGLVVARALVGNASGASSATGELLVYRTVLGPPEGGSVASTPRVLVGPLVVPSLVQVGHVRYTGGAGP
jgi:hypothetical protein